MADLERDMHLVDSLSALPANQRSAQDAVFIRNFNAALANNPAYAQHIEAIDFASATDDSSDVATRGRETEQISDSGRQLFVGPRGGCFYYTDQGSKVYVDRSLCGADNDSQPRTTVAPRSTSGGDVHVRGHYRTTKSGKRVYVRPHTRRRARRH